MTTVKTMKKEDSPAAVLNNPADAQTTPPADTAPPAPPPIDPEVVRTKVKALMTRWEKLRAARLVTQSELDKLADQESDIAREVKGFVGTSFSYKGSMISITERKGERAYFRGVTKPGLVEIE